ncbi:hypothetical protein [Tardiphaga sp.]|uniref:hypothetical protein n=1 Tax=Tardiphaga sp. TaxID=1926292 RepID=UPI00262C0898|nr:hypothetical protein [Tardiphaga sp.]MDB5616223.1 hypothetical protein [Tardiphaga sp.]
MLDQIATTKQEETHYTASETKRFFRVLADLKAAHRAAQNQKNSERYWLARLDDVAFFGGEISTIETHTESAHVRRLCEAAINKYDIDRDWSPAISEDDEHIDGKTATSPAELENRLLFEASYLRGAESDLVAVVDLLSQPDLPRDERAKLIKVRRLHEFELVWLSSVMHSNAGRSECTDIIKKHNIDPATARKRHKI